MKTDYTKKIGILLLVLCLSSISYAQIIEDGTYKILNSVNAEVMTVNTEPQPNDQDIIVGRAIMGVPDEMDDLQLWVFEHLGDDVYRIFNEGDGTYLGIKDGWCGAFGDVQVGFEETSLFNLFRVAPSDLEDTYVIQIAFDDDCNFDSVNDPIKVFDIDGGNPSGKLQTFDINIANPNQQFQIVEPATLNTNQFNLDTFRLVYNNDNRLVSISTLASIEGNSAISIFDINGRNLSNSTHTFSTSFDIDFSSRANGLYFISITNGNYQIVEKVLIY